MRGKSVDHIKRAKQFALDGEGSGIMLTLSTKGKSGIKLDLIQVEKKGEGIGSRVLSNLLRYADINGLFIFLSPSSVFGSDPSALRKWYGGYGFVNINGKELVRKPQDLD